MEAIAMASFSNGADANTSELPSDFPGVQMFGGILSTVGLDPSLLMKVGVTITLLASVFGFMSNAWEGITQIFRFFCDNLVSSATLTSQDESYIYLMRFFKNNNISIDSRLFGVTSRRNVSNPNYQINSYFYDVSKTEQMALDVDGSIKVEDELGPKLKFTPAQGYYTFVYKNRLFIMQRTLKEDYYGVENPDETIWLFTIGRSPVALRSLLEEARVGYLKDQQNHTLVYTTETGYPPSWSIGQPRDIRPLSTVYMKDEDKSRLLKDMREYLTPRSKDWYRRKGVPYRRGYLFHGPPGTGKTSICMALAGALNLKLFVLSLGMSSVSDENLNNFFSTLPKKCIILLEDVDAAGIGREGLYAPGGIMQSLLPESSNDDDVGDDEEEAEKRKLERKKLLAAKNSSVSLSGLLNCIDGIGSHEGRILIMTTNYRQDLDKALIRPGRVDLEMFFGLADTDILEQIFKGVYTDDIEDDEFLKDLEADEKTRSTEKMTASARYVAKIQRLATEFASRVPSNKFTPAEVQGYLLSYKMNVDGAMDYLSEWLESKLSEIELIENKEKKIQEKLDIARAKKLKEFQKKKRDEERSERKELEEIEEEEKARAEKLKAKEKEAMEAKEKEGKEAKDGETKEIDAKENNTKEAVEDDKTKSIPSVVVENADLTEPPSTDISAAPSTDISTVPSPASSATRPPSPIPTDITKDLNPSA